MPWQECKPMDECLRFVAISQYECTKSVKRGDLNPCIDPQRYLEHIDAQEHRFQTMLEIQRAVARQPLLSSRKRVYAAIR